MKNAIYLAAVALPLATTSVQGGTREDVLAAMQRCSVLQDDRTWLECTYGAQQIMRAKLGLIPAPDYQQRLVPPPASTPPISVPLASTGQPAPNKALASAPTPKRRGSFLQILGGSAPPVVSSTLASIQFDAQGGFIVTLQNGQVWHQMDVGDGPKVRFTTGAKVTITSGALWSYNLKTEDNPHSYKVERRS